MLKTSLKQAPTLIVAALSVGAAWPAVFTDAVPPAPSKASSRPPATPGAQPTSPSGPGRSPFRVDRRPTSTAPAPEVAPKSGGLSPSADRPGGAVGPAGKAGPVGKADAVLPPMRLGGTFVDGPDQMAVIDGKVYARGDRLRGPDGSPLPAILAQVRKDGAVIRRGGRDILLTFSDTPRPASKGPATRTGTAPKAAKPREATARPDPSAKAKVADAARTKSSPTPSKNPIAELLTRLIGPGMGGGSGGVGPVPSLPGVEVDEGTIAAGLDALRGKFDDIGREGGPTPAIPGPGPGGGANP